LILSVRMTNTGNGGLGGITGYSKCKYIQL
jgi:hypothetical protein